MELTVPVTVLEQLKIVQESGRVNMVDSNGVQFVAHALRLRELAAWLRRHQHAYDELLMQFGRWLEGEDGVV